MVAKFIGEEGSLKGIELELEGGDEWVVGRDPDACQLLVEDPAASRKHLLCRSTEEGFLLENLSETNPVEINDQPLEGSQILQNGDTIRIGNALFRFYSGEAEQTTEEQPVAEEKIVKTSEEEEHESLLEEEGEAQTAAVDFDLTGTSRWLLKVVAGPNTGAEFSMEPNAQYLIGTDTSSCDVVFHDMSVSKNHARLKVNSGDTLTIEDLDSRNGVLVEGEPVEKELTLLPNKLVTIGTTGFLVCDRESEAHTIASPFLIPTTLTEEKSQEVQEPTHSEEELSEQKAERALQRGAGFIGLIVLTLVLLIVGFSAVSLFRSQEIPIEQIEHDKIIKEALVGYPEISYIFEKGNGRLLLLGHVLSTGDREKILYKLQSHKFVRQVDDNIIVDELIWQENNLIIGKNPDWQGVNMQSPSPGKFVLTGFLKTRNQFDTLSNFINVNFAYPALLDWQVVVEQEVLERVQSMLLDQNFPNVTTEIINGEVTLSGTMGVGESTKLEPLIERFKAIEGVRAVRNYVIERTVAQSVIDLTDQYDVSGYSNQGDIALNVVINGRIIARGDILDGMTVTSIRPGTLFLERSGTKYKIDFSK